MFICRSCIENTPLPTRGDKVYNTLTRRTNTRPKSGFGECPIAPYIASRLARLPHGYDVTFLVLPSARVRTDAPTLGFVVEQRGARFALTTALKVLAVQAALQRCAFEARLCVGYFVVAGGALVAAVGVTRGGHAIGVVDADYRGGEGIRKQLDNECRGAVVCGSFATYFGRCIGIGCSWLLCMALISLWWCFARHFNSKRLSILECPNILEYQCSLRS